MRWRRSDTPFPTTWSSGWARCGRRRQVDDAITAGAEFLVSQVFRRPLVEAAHDRAVPFFPGALTPTEILDAWESGVPAVKVSPIGPVGGLEYFSQVRAPLPDVPLMPTGGVRLDEVNTYLQQGASRGRPQRTPAGRLARGLGRPDRTRAPGQGRHPVAPGPVTSTSRRVVLVAPDKFKGSLTARQAATALASGLTDARPELHRGDLPRRRWR